MNALVQSDHVGWTKIIQQYMVLKSKVTRAFQKHKYLNKPFLQLSSISVVTAFHALGILQTDVSLIQLLEGHLIRRCSIGCNGNNLKFLQAFARRR